MMHYSFQKNYGGSVFTFFEFSTALELTEDADEDDEDDEDVEEE